MISKAQGTPDSISRHLLERTRHNREWSQPDEFDLSEEEGRLRLAKLIENGRVNTVVDRSAVIASELFALKTPGAKNNTLLKTTFVRDILQQGVAYGRWIHFPWSGVLARFPEKTDHRALRTSRNRYLIREEEQQLLYDATIAIFGLSVGSNAVERLLASGIGGKFILADKDVLEPSNLNRVSGGFLDVGDRKLDVVAKRISETDPYIEQVHLPEGVTDTNLEQLGSGNRPDLVIEEVDDLRMKARIRLFAKQAKIALVMATDVGDKSLIDVERYDLGGTRPFNGRLSEAEVHKLEHEALTPREARKVMVKLIGLTNVTPRVLESARSVDRTLAGLPQLGVTASIGGNLATLCAREILLGRRLPSGRYVCSPKRILSLSSPTSLRAGAKSLFEFARSSRQS